MSCIAFRGMRGGVGTTSSAAAVGHALHAMGKTVLMMDLSASNLLRLHFGAAYGDHRGWAPAQVSGAVWYDAVHEIEPGLDLLPFGKPPAADRAASNPLLELTAGWAGHLAILRARYDVVLIDMPACEAAALPLMADCGLCINTMEADAAGYALMAGFPHRSNFRYLLTRFDPFSRLQRDIRLLLQGQWGDALIPEVVHRDESMAEALGHKKTVGSYCPQSLAAQDAANLAAWCLAREQGI